MAEEQAADGRVLWLLADGQRSIVSTVVHNGGGYREEQLLTYDALGRPLIAYDRFFASAGYAGRLYDPQLRLYDYGHGKVYDADAGRFINVPTKSTGGNPYHNAELVGKTTKAGQDLTTPELKDDRNWFEKAVYTSVNWLADMKDAAIEGVKNAGRSIGNLGSSIIQGAGKMLKQAVTDPLGFTGDVLTGMGEFVLEAVNMVAHPIDTVVGVGQFAYALGTHPLDTLAAVGDAMSQEFNDNPTKAFTKIAGDILSGKLAAKVIGLSKRVAGLANKADDFADAGRAAKRATGQCFPAGTLVSSADCLKPIEACSPTELVWAFNVKCNRWELRPIVETYEFDYVGDMVAITIAGEQLESTYHHPFWVIEGRDLASRPKPDHVMQATVAGAAITGRWVDAGDLEIGDDLLFMDGRRRSITALNVRPAAEKVYNLQVQGLHTYAVGRNRLLVHNYCGDTVELPDGNRLPFVSMENFIVNSKHAPRATPVPAEPVVGSGRAYSVAYQMKMKLPANPKKTRDAHFRAANESLFSEMDADTEFASQMRRTIPGIDKVRGTGDAPDNWVWNHLASDAGVMELVPDVQHWSPNPLWSLFHPKLNGKNIGGFKRWGHLY